MFEDYNDVDGDFEEEERKKKERKRPGLSLLHKFKKFLALKQCSIFY